MALTAKQKRLIKQALAGQPGAAEAICDAIDHTPQTAITAASEAHALNSTFSDTEAEAALNALGVKLNLVITALEVHGILAAN